MAKVQEGLPADRILYNHKLWAVNNNIVRGAVEPPLYDLAQIGPFAFIGKNNFDAGLLWSTVYEEGQHLLQLQGKLLTNADVLLSEISIKAVQLQNHHYYPYWSSLTYQQIDFGISKNKRRLQNALDKK